MGKYKTVVIDFPWPLKLGGSVPEKMQGTALNPALPYQTSELEDIRNFPIEDFAADDCLLFLWATCGKVKSGEPIIRLAVDILEEWRFTYHTILTWHKENPFSFWSPIRWATEHIIFGYRGEFPKIYAKMPSIFKAHNVRHSEKPARFYQLLRSWTSAPRIDLFARRAHPGFDGWGNEYVYDGPLAPFLEQSTNTGAPSLQERNPSLVNDLKDAPVTPTRKDNTGVSSSIHAASMSGRAGKETPVTFWLCHCGAIIYERE